MAALNVCAVVVTYHPDKDVLENLRALRPQVDSLNVVDNGSSEEELAPVRALARELFFKLQELGDNLGIATALNRGIRPRLGNAGVEWFLLFDQDSQVTPGFVEAMLRGYRASAFGEHLALLVPRYQDKRTGDRIVTDRLPSGGIEAAMTSGSLIRADTFEHHGLFLDELFIDMVDSEYSLRLRAAGRVLDEYDEAVLLHSPASPRRHLAFTTGNYSPIRHYYQQRNRIFVARHYGRLFPRYLFRLFIASAKDAVKIVLAEQQKWAKLSAFFAGLSDGIRNRMGKRSI